MTEEFKPHCFAWARLQAHLNLKTLGKMAYGEKGYNKITKKLLKEIKKREKEYADKGWP